MDSNRSSSYIDYLKKYGFGREYEWFNKDWLLTKNGDMLNAIADYEILNDELQGNLFCRLMSKKWFDANTFLPAYFQACMRAGLEHVTINIIYA